jgi:hypothetical protein
MLPRKTVAALERLFVTLHRSLSMYLADAVPWTRQEDHRAVEVLRYIVADQKGSCARLAGYLQSHHVPLNTGHYPMSFTDTNDLSLGFLVTLLADGQKADVVTIERLISDLNNDPHALALAEEALGGARAHLEALQELHSRVVGAASAPTAGTIGGGATTSGAGGGGTAAADQASAPAAG